MEEEKKKKVAKMLWTGLAIGLSCFVLGAIIGGCTAKMGEEKAVNALTSQNNGYEKVYDLNEPKKTDYPWNPIEIKNNSNLNLEWLSVGRLTDSGSITRGTKDFDINKYIQQEGDSVTFFYDEEGYLEVSSNGSEWSSGAIERFELTYKLLWNGPWATLMDLTFDFSTSSPVTIHYDLPEGSPNLKLEQIDNWSVLQQWTAPATFQLERSVLFGKALDIGYLDALWSSSTSYNDDLSGGSNTNHSLCYFTTWGKMTDDIYITPRYQIVQMNNRTGYSMDYGTYSFAITTNTGTNQVSGSRSIVAWSKGVDQFSPSTNEKYLTIWCDYPFVVKHDGFASGYYTAIYGNRNDTFMKDKYFVTIAKEEIKPNGTITIQLAGSEGTENGLNGPLALIGQAFGSLMPILQIKIFGDFTIGLLVAIPLIFAMIVMIFKLIKK